MAVLNSFNLQLLLQEPDIERENPWAPKATIHSLPNELLLYIFPLLPVKSLILARGVSHQWRHLISVSFLLPARRILLDFFLDVIKSPSFLKTRELLLPELRDLDRHDYISTIENETGAQLPEEFRTWILEWPTKAVPTWLWPGLDSVQPRPLHRILPRQTMNLLKSFGMRPRKIHLRHRSTSDDTVVLRPMRYTEPTDAARDWCWMIIVQVSRDPFAMDFLLFGGEGLGAGVNDTVLMVKDDVVRPGMGWVDYMRKEVKKQDECYLKGIEEPGATSSPHTSSSSTAQLPLVAMSALQPIQQPNSLGLKVRRSVQTIKNRCVRVWAAAASRLAVSLPKF